MNLSESIVHYTGYGKENHPGEYPDWVINSFGQHISGRLLPVVEQILAELNQLKPDWSSLSLVQAGKWARGKMQVKYPTLNDDALNALEWTFTWWWK